MKALGLKILSDRKYGPAIYELMSGIFDEADLETLNTIKTNLFKEEIIKKKLSVTPYLVIEPLTPEIVRGVIHYMKRCSAIQGYLPDGYAFPEKITAIKKVNVPKLVEAFQNFRMVHAKMQFPTKEIHLSMEEYGDKFTVDDEKDVHEFSENPDYVEPDSDEKSQIKSIMTFIRNTDINDTLDKRREQCDENIQRLTEEYDAAVQREGEEGSGSVPHGGSIDPQFKKQWADHLNKMLLQKNNLDTINMFTTLHDEPREEDDQPTDYLYLNEMKHFFELRNMLADEYTFL